jgi:hypothetical protein
LDPRQKSKKSRQLEGRTLFARGRQLGILRPISFSLSVALVAWATARRRYTRSVEIPFRRESLAERNAIDDAEATAELRQLSPGQRLARALDLSDTARALARSVGARWLDEATDELADKARRTPTTVVR